MSTSRTRSMPSATNSHLDPGDIMEVADSKTATGSKTSMSSGHESHVSDDSEMEPFENYRRRIEQALAFIGMEGFDIEPLHHGYTFQNCVYALTSKDNTRKYILRVPVCPDLGETDEKCEAIENDAFLLDYLQGKLPVPRVKAICATTDNALNKPFMVQTRLSGQPLDDIYGSLKQEEKLAIVDQIVNLMTELESIQFSKAGTFTISSLETTDSFAPIKVFSEGNSDFVKLRTTTLDRQGPDLKSFLTSHVQGWIAQELRDEGSEEQSLTIGSWKKVLSMLDTLDNEGAFAKAPCPIVLHHWDFEPRNIMVEQDSSNKWHITGVIDWDDALALPRPLARRPLDWIWDWNPEGFTGYLDTDHHPKKELSDEEKELKAAFDSLAAKKLKGYLEDAYGHGRWLRRIWTFAKLGIYSTWYLDLVKLLIDDWEARPKPIPVVHEWWTLRSMIKMVKDSFSPKNLIKKARQRLRRLLKKL